MFVNSKRPKKLFKVGPPTPLRGTPESRWGAALFLWVGRAVRTKKFFESLLPAHAEMLRCSAISDEVAEARGYRSLTKKCELEELGFGKNQRRIPALLLPIHGVHGGIVQYQARPDMPRVDRRSRNM